MGEKANLSEVRMKLGKKKELRLPLDLSSRVIDELGGTKQVAEACEVTTAAVSQWRQHGMPRYRFVYLRERFRRLPFMKSREILEQ